MYLSTLKDTTNLYFWCELLAFNTGRCTYIRMYVHYVCVYNSLLEVGLIDVCIHMYILTYISIQYYTVQLAL